MQNSRYFLISMPAVAPNPNLHRRRFPGLVAWLAAPLLKPLLLCLGLRSNKKGGKVSSLTIFESYMVGDFFMALPALKKLAARENHPPFVVLCRPDCVDLLAREGIVGIPFVNPFKVRVSAATFLATWRAAWALRGHLGPVALDLDADPRTAFWLKVAGVQRVVSYRRAFNVLFDETFELPEPSVHQADKDRRVIEEWVKREGGPGTADNGENNPPSPLTIANQPSAARRLPSTPWIISLWTRKATKNWPLSHWELLLGKLLTEGIPFRILTPPDADTEFLEFQRRWAGRAEFLSGTLLEIADVVRDSAGVIATDNFLGHMAGYYGKPVLWINLCSPEEQVTPRGPRTIVATNPSVEEVQRAFAQLTDH